MKCPFCSSINTKVIDSRPLEETNSIRRRRQCEECKKRFTTYENIESIPLIVIKKDKRKEYFNKNKIISGIATSCHKCSISMEEIEDIVDEIENSILNQLTKEIESKKIGEIVMSHLKKLDEVAYVRFASVYKEFKDVNTFMKELKNIIDN